MSQNFSAMLLEGVASSGDLTIQDIPLMINMVDTSYPLAFIDYEEDDTMGINYTAEDGTERFVVVNKKYVVDIEVMYQQDIKILTDEEPEEKPDVMYQ